MKILYNHIGYETESAKQAIIESDKSLESVKVKIVDYNTGKTVYSGFPIKAGNVDGWKGRTFWMFDFSEYTREGRYYLSISGESNQVKSESFLIDNDLFLSVTGSDVINYFKIMRCSGRFDRADRNARFYGSREGQKDLHGGWYDASGDTSKYLSHLSYANFMNPQQIPLVVWNLLEGLEVLKRMKKTYYPLLKERVIEEALFGADFIVRMQDEDGYFYMTLFDQWSKDPENRIISAFRGQDGNRSDNYQAGYRQGGGMAIAALARAGSLNKNSDYAPHAYIEAAKKGFHHLEEHNREYLDDGRENIIDDYCALLAACELYAVTGKERYRFSAEKRAENLIGRLSSDNNYTDWFRADDSGEIPFFHASDAGLPVVSMFRFLEVFPGTMLKTKVENTIRRSLSFEIKITGEVVNPFGYPRQYIKPCESTKRGAFFIPHNNWSGYWWQGENARLASLSTAAFLGADYFSKDLDFSRSLKKYGRANINWILGMNPFDTCMLQGEGHNNPEYEKALPNVNGGIVNGITSGFDDENDIDFLPAKVALDGRHRWRWSEQWLPHAAWYFLSVCTS